MRVPQRESMFPALDDLWRRRAGGAKKTATIDKEHLNNAIDFFKRLQTLRSIPQAEQLKVLSSAVVTLGEAAIMCNIGAQELWRNYVILGILRMYNGDVPATEFIRVTHLLQDVISFFCGQEKIRRYYSQSYQKEVKYIIAYSAKSDDVAKQVNLSFSFYFNMSHEEAINFESMTISLSRYFEFYPFQEGHAAMARAEAAPDNKKPPVAEEHSLSAEERAAGIKTWMEHRGTLPSSSFRELRRWRDAHIAELLFSEKTYKQIFDIVFPNEKNKSNNIKKTRIYEARKRIEKDPLVRGGQLPAPPPRS